MRGAGQRRDSQPCGLTMTDIVSPAERARIMSKIRSRGNKSTELRLIALLKEMGVKGWRRGYPVKGKPDFVFLNYKIAIFTDGCFWHGHGCRVAKPQTRSDYWTKKISRNMERDKKVTKMFESRGWLVIRVWECEFRHKAAEARKKLGWLRALLDESPQD